MKQSDWEEFCDRLKKAGQLISESNAPRDALTQAEGYRYLTRLLRAGLESSVEGSDPRFPVFYSLSHDTIKIGNDNPDNYYLNCCVSGNLDYVIDGEFGEVDYFSIATKAGSYATTGDMKPTGEIDSDQIHADENGRFRINVSSKRPAKNRENWLAMEPQSDNLIIRQYCNARREHPAQFNIRCLNPGPVGNINTEEFSQKLSRAISFVEGTSGLFRTWIEQFKDHSNRLPANDQAMCLRVGGNENIHYHNSHWQLSENEALIIQPERIPKCTAWNFQISNYWMESLDYRYFPISYNDRSARPNADGNYTLIVAHKKPPSKYLNWINTAGHSQGGMLFRWIDAQDFPLIQTRVVKFSDL